MNKVPNRVYHIISNKNVTILSSYVSKLIHYYYCKIPNKKNPFMLDSYENVITNGYHNMSWLYWIYISIEMNLIKFIKTKV